ncbi:hypothetical protein F4804DRAFT_352793 [Jackrogersella minutella]|nr:hypothetical protein F4804DRAFT_352793 [Jackrogersella minutella]
MQQSSCDGLPVICSPSCDPAPNQLRNCATQSTGGSTDLPKADPSYYLFSPSSQLAEIGQHAQHTQSQLSSSSLFPSAINTSIPTYQYPQVHSAGSSSQGVWPTPPSTTCEGEEFDGYSFHDSPASASCKIPTYSAHSSAPSPGSWPSQEAQQIGYQQPMQSYNYHAYNPLQYNQQLVNPPTSMMAQQEVPSAASSIADHNLAAGPEGEAVGPKQENVGTKKVDEPYAQLIWRAFLSSPTHSMTLQELYQWFRDNTDKAKNDKCDKGEKDEARGWMNSIRHNLSMNQAFVKRDRKLSPGESVNESGDAKKVSEWVLEDWAVNGVQSTTRYRSKGTSNRRGGPGSRPRTRASLSGRANSGRRGGVAASNSKRNAATRRAMITQHDHNPAFPNMVNNNGNFHDPTQNIGYDHRLSLQYHLPTASGGNTITPPDPSHEAMMLTTNPTQSTVLPAPDPNHPFSFAPNIPQYDQSSHHQMYSLEDVTGMYQGQQPPIPMQGGQGMSTTMPQDLNALFEDPEASRNNRLTFSYWHDPSTGGHYQS